MPKISAGILLFRFINLYPEILLFHPGGPYWARKDAGAWSIAKGELNEDETPIHAAERELKEESGITIMGDLIELGSIKPKNNKLVFAWALEQDFDPSNLQSNLFEIEWPPASGKKQSFPEMDQACWFTLDEAKQKILESQIPFIEALEKKI
jgi:predicted NUDIX family NTP pyrophosphohydrolase